MTRRFRIQVPEEGCWYWFEVEEDGWASREAVFDATLEVPRLPEPFERLAGSPAGGASVAASLAELSVVREKFGLVGVQLYETVYGVLAEGPVERPPHAEDVTEAEFERAWSAAVRHRHFTRYDTGPLPVGSCVTGTVSALPWGPGRTGLFVDIGSPAAGFVDMGWLPHDPDGWPPVGTVAEFEVVTIRFDLRPEYTGLQVRLRPTATPPPGEPWPRPGRR
ncbi:hypothetical protein G5C60_15120 [Streptomyces sp. HC44]|uniref:Uncharacterized protein n=1 Tax=Streptomyces scabichelini TaxID=2711217 RepID=A0A6G4V4V0_9ACTN|nr:hypothetical protein [Streptomyces scabichelini]NGO08897.1 hypothetical protein [Streptomyces scabichelini]